LRLVRHHPLDPDAALSQVRRGPEQEPGAGLTTLVGMNLDVGVAGVIIDRDVQVVVAGTSAFLTPRRGALAEHLPATTGTDPAERRETSPTMGHESLLPVWVP